MKSPAKGKDLLSKIRSSPFGVQLLIVILVGALIPQLFVRAKIGTYVGVIIVAALIVAGYTFVTKSKPE